MAGASFKIKGAKSFWRALAPKKISADMKREVSKALDLTSLQVVKEIRKNIQGGRFLGNAALTAAIKGQNKPLVDFGQLFQAIGFKRVGEYERQVGVTKMSGDALNIAMVVHNGAVIKVTDKMRGLFFLLWLASMDRIPKSELRGRAAELFKRMPGGWKPLSESTTHIRIPPRRFIDEVFKSRRVRKMFKDNVNGAIERVMARRAREARGGE